ncbi:TPA: TetR/AcrR family transcriptional regulator [Burkholderia multivorans]|nr:TetR/AcrR family transcriptional regulator [Burkholderia multivorans]HEM7872499.1 TetR/AcrR family transcriptional regulator [Burkholderia multivorans]HEM7908577.1 TetR/AcrR family transcriptional regulator [Burkholderia multivorans]HEM8539265.1 TetR/AcrR family transcriptional regulator [Burkholderia multivorans]
MSPSPISPKPANRRTAETPRQKTRSRIAAAAKAEFLEVGYETASIEGIARRAGVSRATYYIHFTNKVEVLVEIWHTSIDKDILEIIADFDALGAFPTRSALRKWIDKAVSYWEKSADMVELTAQVLALDPQMTGPWVELNVQAVNAMPNYLSRFSTRELPLARMRMSMLLLQLDRMCFILNRGELPQGRPVLIDALTDIWWRCLKPEADDERKERR